MDLPNLKYLTQAGGKLSNDLILEFHNICKKKKIDFYVMYGQTEATARMSYLPPESLPDKVGSIGFPIPEGEFRLRDEIGHFFDDAHKKGIDIFWQKHICVYSRSYHDLDDIEINKGLVREILP